VAGREGLPSHLFSEMKQIEMLWQTGRKNKFFKEI